MELTDYTDDVPDPTSPGDQPRSLRAEQVAQTRAALVAAGRHLFGRDGFASTSVEDVAREARVTIGALYHHFATKTELFETVFEAVHAEMLAAAARAAEGAADEVAFLDRGFEAFLDAVLDPETQQITLVDAPAVLGLARFTELDERFAFAVIVDAIGAAVRAGKLRVEDPETMTRLLLGALTRGAMLIANSSEPVKTRNAVANSVRELFAGLSTTGSA